MSEVKMSDSFPNPMGTDGFEVVEFTATDPAELERLFGRLGFTAVARHRARDVILYRQGEINFLLNREPDSFAADFARKHGPSACGFGIRVKDAARAHRLALGKGARPVAHEARTLALDTPAIE